MDRQIKEENEIVDPNSPLRPCKDTGKVDSNVADNSVEPLPG